MDASPAARSSSDGCRAPVAVALARTGAGPGAARVCVFSRVAGSEDDVGNEKTT